MPPARSGPYQSTLRPTTGTQDPSQASDDRAFQRPPLRRVSPEQQNTYARRIANETAGPSTTQPTQSTAPGTQVRINEQSVEGNRAMPSTFTRPPDIPLRTQESTFEKVPLNGGPVSYLGMGTFSQFEHCWQ